MKHIKKFKEIEPENDFDKKEAPNWSKEKVDDLINTTNDAENFLAYVKGGMKGEYNPKKKY